MDALEGGIAAFLLRTIGAARSQKILRYLCPATAMEREASCPHCRVWREDQQQPSQAPGSLLTPAALLHFPNLNSVQLTLLGSGTRRHVTTVLLAYSNLIPTSEPSCKPICRLLLQKSAQVKHKFATWPSNFIPSYLPKSNENVSTQKLVQNVYSSNTHNSQNVQMIQISVSWWVGKQNVGHLYNGILLGNK